MLQPNNRFYFSSSKWYQSLFFTFNILAILSTTCASQNEETFYGTIKINNGDEETMDLRDGTVRWEFDALTDVATASITSGPPGYGCVFVAAPDDSSRFVSQTIFSPATRTHFRKAASSLNEAFPAALSLACFVHPSIENIRNSVAVLFQSSDLPFGAALERRPVRSSDPHALAFMWFDIGEDDGWDLNPLAEQPISVDKAAIVYTSTKDPACALVSESRGMLDIFNLRNPYLERFEEADLALCAKSRRILNQFGE